MDEVDATMRRGTVTNISSGTVGIQGGQVTGSTVWMGVAPQAPSEVSLAGELSMFRDLLVRSRSAGNLDDLTYDAATAELDIASEALEENTADGQSKVVLALKRLRGLVVDVAELATKIAALIVAAKGM